MIKVNWRRNVFIYLNWHFFAGLIITGYLKHTFMSRILKNIKNLKLEKSVKAIGLAIFETWKKNLFSLFESLRCIIMRAF